ncbi:transcription initiation factor TFIID subunit 12b isoform X1 [Tanacetum coccineum]
MVGKYGGGERNYNLTIPGFSSEEKKQEQNNPSSDIHKKRLDLIQGLMENSYSETNANNSKEPARPVPQNQFGANQMMRPSPSSDQLIARSSSSQNLQHKQGFTELEGAKGVNLYDIEDRGGGSFSEQTDGIVMQHS